ncbi:MAG: hypothetical protein MUF31_02800 [Akkermansiaceae bacterium]|jgi:hypothetical protein|nr:hypothetical protein [Akkermansiaceae bacterium]
MSSQENEGNIVKLPAHVPADIARKVGEEVIKSEYDPAVWAEALASVRGQRDEAVAAYSRLRIARLMERRNRAEEKSREVEYRRLNTCLGVRTVKELLNGMSRVGNQNLPRPRLPWFWLGLLALGIAGTSSAAARLLASDWIAPMEGRLPFFALGLGMIAVLGIMVVGRFLSNYWQLRLWGEGMVAACALACVSSFLLGTKLMMKYPASAPQVAQRVTAQVPMEDESTRVASGLMVPCSYETPALVNFDEE